MPRPGYQTITVKDEAFKLLDTIPGGSRSEKVERLIHDASAALFQPNLNSPTSSRAVISDVLSLAPNWDKDHVWELVYQLLDLLRHPLSVPISEKVDSSKKDTDKPEITDIPSLVHKHMTRLKKTGVKNLIAIASGKQLPSITDFTIIAAELGLSEEEQRQIWTKTFNHAPKKKGVSNGSH